MGSSWQQFSGIFNIHLSSMLCHCIARIPMVTIIINISGLLNVPYMCMVYGIYRALAVLKGRNLLTEKNGRGFNQGLEAKQTFEQQFRFFVLYFGMLSRENASCKAVKQYFKNAQHFRAFKQFDTFDK